MIETIFILHHTHVDLGYTDRREKVCRDLVNMVERAMELVEQYRDRPQMERFRWIHEVSWPVVEYLRQGGGNAEKLFEQMRQGESELTAFYVNPTELFDQAEWERSLDYSCRLAKDHQLPLTTAMFSDCPGLAWSMADLLAERGITYLSASPDFIMSYPLEIERPFYWEGPEGGRVLVWSADWRINWYAEGHNVLKLHEDPAAATERVLRYIGKLEGEGYRWKGLAIHFANDNAWPEPRVAEFVRHFNVSQDGVKAQMATNGQFFAAMENWHKGEFSVHRGAWPDWWANGHGSAAFETSCSRRAKEAMARCRAIRDWRKQTGECEGLEQAAENVLLYDEHTFGHSTSAMAPWNPLARSEWNVKRNYALWGLADSQSLEQQLAGEFARPGQIAVVNPFGEAWQGVVSLHNKPKSRTGDLIDAQTGERFCGQRSLVCSEGQLPEDSYAVSVPARSVRYFRREKAKAGKGTISAGMETEQYRLDVNSETGAVRSILDKASGMPLCEAGGWSFGELIHERIRRGSRERLYDIHCGMLKEESKRPCPEFVRQGGHAGKRAVRIAAGAVYHSLITRGRLPKVSFVREIRLYHAMPRIDVIVRFDKEIQTSYESLYLSFPFGVKSPEVWLELAGAVYRAGVDQLPGSAADWHSAGDYLAVSGEDRTVVLVPHDCPLVQIGDINTGKWQRRLEVRSGHVFSWILNNMWPTNFPIYQEGQMLFRWSMTVFPGRFDRQAAERFVQQVRDLTVVDPDHPRQLANWGEFADCSCYYL